MAHPYLAAFVRGALGIFSGLQPGPTADMLTGITPGAVGEAPPRGTREHLAVYSQAPWVRAVVGRIADSVAAVQWRLYVVGSPGQRARYEPVIARARGIARRKLLAERARTGDLREIERHVFLDTWGTGNSFLTGQATRKVTQIFLEAVGEALLLKERNALGTTVGLWPVPPDWVLSTPTPMRRFYRVSYRGWQATVPETEMLWLTDPNPSNPYGRGTGIVRALGDEIEADEYAARTIKQWFFNNARPDLLVMPREGEAMEEPEARRAELRWLQRQAGFWNRWRPLFLSRLMEVKELSQDFRKGQFVQIREHERDVILQTWGIPPEILGVVENSNRATIQAADYLYQSNVIVPRLEFLRATIQERLLPEYDPRLILDYVSPVGADEVQLLEAAKAAPWARDVDEWRQAQGLEPLADDAGKVFLVPTNVRAVTQPIEAQPVVAAPFGGVAPEPKGLAALNEEELRQLQRLIAKVEAA